MSKSQTSLFSFFKKSTSSATVPTVASDSKMDVMKPGSVVPKLNETKVKTLPPENRKRVICDDDEEEWNCGDIETPSKKAKASKVSDDESEASFEVSDSDESVSDLCDSSDDDDYKRTPKKAKVSSAPKSPSTTKISTSNDTPSSKMKPSAFVTPTKSPSLFSTPGSNNSKSSIGNTPDKDSETPASGVRLNGTHEHHKWPFMQPNTIKDIDGHRPDHPDYNPRTMSMPRSFLESQTPGMRQWCEFKMRNMDTVLFFKVGKFYELFHMDADVGFEELDLIYMKGDKAHSGFPEISYGKYATMLISKGFRVARVEQTETPEMLKERNDSASKGKKKDKVVLREMCSIMSRGTRTYSHLDDLSLLNESVSELSNESSAFDMPKESILMCITEIKLETNTEIVNIDNIRTEDEDDIGGYGERAPVVGYGVCCIDTVLGDVTFAQFHDDEQRNRLRTMLAQYFPSEIILEHGRFSDETMGAIKLIVPGVAFEYLRAKEIPTVKSTLSMLTAGEYFPESVPGSSIYSTYPLILQEIIEGLSGEEQNESFSSDLMFKAFGGVLWLLKKCLIDLQLISYGKCHGYVPPDETKLASGIGCSATAADTGADSSTSLLVSFIRSDMDLDAESELMSAVNADTDTVATDTTACVTATSTTPSTPPAPIVKHMTLDAVALSNLEILVNNYDKTSRGSLWEFINHTKTAFGRRLLHNWLCKPLYNVHEIKMRTLAVNDLLTDLSIEAGKCSGFLKGLPDLERLLSRIHCNGNKKRSVEHPDSRAVYYEAPLYNSRKIKDFADVLSGFESVLKIIEVFRNKGSLMNSALLKRITQSNAPIADVNDPQAALSPIGKFPYEKAKELLLYFRSIFDEKQAKRDGNIKPLPGVDADYDQAKADIANIESSLQAYLKEMKKVTNIPEIVYWGSNKDRYQLEVPISKSSRVPSDWNTKSQKKTHRRYWTPVIEDLFDKLQHAEVRMASAQKDTMRRIFEKFDSNITTWTLGVNCISILDALLSLALVSSNPEYVWPVMIQKTEQIKPFIHIENGRHPMLEQALSGKSDSQSYIPNSLVLGGVRNNLEQEDVSEDVISQTAPVSEDCYVYTPSQNHQGAFGTTASLNRTESSSVQSKVPECIPRLLLLSGPNMGGKSTLLRQTCLIAIMAQLGCKVPAESCAMTPVDRIFTRVGASDKILSGQSTFYVELAETANILLSATEDSLCILDELGRGTATFDGTAIAHSVVHFLVNQLKCRCLFATHYHSLVEDWSIDPRVHLGHMDCIVEGLDENEDTDNKHAEQVTFLYKLCDGSSPRSYGINVARLAKLPQQVIEMAMKQSRAFESKMNRNIQQTQMKQNIQLDALSANTNAINYKTVSNFYYTLKSILKNKKLSCDEDKKDLEFVYIIQELWYRFHHTSKY